jgi:hypothetical protein
MSSNIKTKGLFVLAFLFFVKHVRLVLIYNGFYSFYSVFFWYCVRRISSYDSCSNIILAMQWLKYVKTYNYDYD